MGSVASLIRTNAGPGQGNGDRSETEMQNVESRLDEALKETFPASDPIAVSGDRARA